MPRTKGKVDGIETWCDTTMPRPAGWMEGKVKSPAYDKRHDACVDIESKSKCEKTSVTGTPCTWKERIWS